METIVFKAGDIVYDNVRVPEGNEFHETHEEENRRLHVKWYQGGALILDIYVPDFYNDIIPVQNQRQLWWEQYLITNKRMTENK